MPLLDDNGNPIHLTEPDVTDPNADQSQPDTPSDEGALPQTDISNKTFRYNPPLHSASLFKRVDFGSESGLYTVGSLYDEDGAPKDYDDTWASKNLNSLRLGRIIQHTIVPGFAALMKHRWGFRFLYNPTSLSFSASRNNSFIIDGRSEANMAMSGINQNFQTISMEIFLDRTADVLSDGIKAGDYSPALRSGDLEGIRRYGTHWDLEALFKVCNGEWDLTDRGKTSNIGVLIPSNARLILGKGDNLYGFVERVSYEDMMFSVDMIPVRTKVSLTFHRHIDMTPEQVTTSFPGFGSIGVEDDSGDGGGDDGSPSTGHYTGSTATVEKAISASYRSKYITPGPQVSVEKALSRAQNLVGKNRYAGRCIVFVTSGAYGNPEGSIGIASAYQVWGNCPSSLRHPGDYDAPPGAVLVWNSSLGGGHGHAAISIGDRKMITTTGGAIAVSDIWRSHYYGWIPPVFYGSRRRP